MQALRVLALLSVLLPAVARAQGTDDFAVERAAEPPRIDGVMDDAVWSRAPLAIPADGWVSYQPVRGDKMSAGARSSWKAWGCSTSPAPAATATCAPPSTPAASSIRTGAAS